jgi:hypothetical protein
MSKDGKHHYIPVFYLKQWTGADQRLCEFKQRYCGVLPRRVYPDMTAYVHGLNTIPGLPAEIAQYLETHFFAMTDTYASRALRILLAERPWKFSDHERSGWSRFITSLVLRNPEMVERFKVAGLEMFNGALPAIEADYSKNRLETDPPTYAEYAALKSPNPAGRAAAKLMEEVIDDPKINQHIINMRWRVFKTTTSHLPFLTSDRPVMMTKGIDQPSSQIILPISPHYVFAATNTAETENMLLEVAKEGSLVEQVNERVTIQARSLVFGTNKSCLRFVADRLGKQYTPSPLEGPSTILKPRT